MGKRFKIRKKKKSKLILYLLIIFICICIEPYISKIKLNNSNENLINSLLYSMTSSYNLSEKTIYKIIKNSIKSSFNSPEYILKAELQYINNDSEVKDDINLVFKENKLPLIYIYNSHQGEQYSNEYLEDYNILPSVITASYMFEEKLEALGINTLVEENDILDYMKKNNMNHSQSYIASRHFLTNILKKYDSIKLYIDLHRDSVSHDITTISIDGKKYAKVMFVIGLKYNTYENNLSVVERLNNKLNDKYPGISRGILKKGTVGANGVYNQDLDSRIILIELGGNENNIDEINNTLEILSNIIGEYINEKE